MPAKRTTRKAPKKTTAKKAVKKTAPKKKAPAKRKAAPKRKVAVKTVMVRAVMDWRHGQAHVNGRRVKFSKMPTGTEVMVPVPASEVA